MGRISSLARLLRLDPVLAVKYAGNRLKPDRARATSTGRVNGRVAFEFDLTLDPAMKDMRREVYEVWTLRALRAFIAPNDTVVDAGANIGYITAYAASLVGPGGQVHSFEPVPRYYSRLERLAALNPGYLLHLNNCALGDREGTGSIAVTSAANIGWNTMVDGFMSRETTAQVLPVKVRRLDTYLRENGVEHVAFIKIDVEGFELPVLRGLENFLKATAARSRPVLLVEVAPGAYPLLHLSLEQLEQFFGEYRYSVRLLNNPGQKPRLTALTETTNVLCLPPTAA